MFRLRYSPYSSCVRLVTTEGDLARKGFADPARAAQHVAALCAHHEDGAAFFIDEAAHTIDPDVALSTLVQVLDADPPRVHSLVEDPAFARRLLAVLGGSAELGRTLVQRAADIEVLRAEPVRRSATELVAELVQAVGADPGDPLPVATADKAADALRHAYRRELVRIAARDLTAPDPLEVLQDIAAELADLADAALQAAVAIGRTTVKGHDRIRFAVLALGKTGAQELNYISDVDVLYVVEPALDEAGEPQMRPR